jgi:hypothetical protein
MIGFFRDLPEAVRDASEVQRRMWGTVPAIESSIEKTAELLSAMTKADHQRLAKNLKADPDLPMRVCAALEGALANEWVDDALSKTRHLHLRALVAELAFRLQHQPTDAVIGDLLSRHEKIGRFAVADPQVDIMIEAAANPVSWAARETRKRKASTPTDNPTAIIMLGLALCGLGIAVGLVSIIVAASGNIGGFFGATAGVLLLLIGLIVLVGGGIWLVAVSSGKKK